MGGRTLFQARRREYFNTVKRGSLPLPCWWEIALSGQNRLLAQTHQCTEQFIRHMGRAPERHRMVWTGRNLKDHRVPTPVISRAPPTTRAQYSSVTLYPNHGNYFYSCVTSHFPSMPQNQCLFYIRIQNASLF